MNKNKLRSVMISNGDNYCSLSEYLGITTTTFSKKINEKKGAGFNQHEMSKIKNKYNLDVQEFCDIFFAKQVS